tara:strand:+ start:4050 stop:4508 length:459 start_codon:yes stop_codon:yes gene_type:complete
MINLKEVDLKLLLLLWSNTKDGKVPADANEAAFLAGYGQKQKTSRIEQALNTLHEVGFLQRDVEGYFFAEWQQIMRKKFAKFQKSSANFRKQNKEKQEVAQDTTRARLYSPIENIENDLKNPLFEGGGFQGQEGEELNKRAIEIMKEVKNEN